LLIGRPIGTVGPVGPGGPGGSSAATYRCQDESMQVSVGPYWLNSVAAQPSVNRRASSTGSASPPANTIRSASQPANASCRTSPASTDGTKCATVTPLPRNAAPSRAKSG
jgi:hypothetical protein